MSTTTAPGGTTIQLDNVTADKIRAYITAHPESVLHIPEVRALVARERLRDFQKIQEYAEPSEAVAAHTVIHNLNTLQYADVPWRPALLFQPLTAIEYIRLQAGALRLLIIGPRSEAEIFTAYAHGFRDITAIDILSYSPLIQLGDMHNLPYSNGAFDVVVAGWVLAYSQDNARAAREILRVTKPQGHIAVGCVAEPRPEGFSPVGIKGGVLHTSDDPERPGETKTVSRFYDIEQLYWLFNPHIDTVLFRESPHPALAGKRANFLYIFRKR